MCQRFIEDLANKIIEKTNLENLSITELKEINSQSQKLINERTTNIRDEMDKSYTVENYLILRDSYLTLSITLMPSCQKQFSFGYSPSPDKCNQKFFFFHKKTSLSFLTKEELVNHICLTINVEDKQTLYDICLKKITLLQDYIDNY